MIDENGRLRDAGSMIGDWRGTTLDSDTFARMHDTYLPFARETAPRLGAPIGGIRKIIGVGLNYRAHAAEAGTAPPSDPIIFLKSPDAASGPNDDIVLPPGGEQVDWEVELGVVIGREGKNVKQARALDCIAGYLIANDVSAREWQLKRGGQWTKGKSADTFAPLGPCLVTPDDLPDPQNLSLQLFLNGELKQSGSTRDMIFGVAELIARISEYMRLQPGDIIITGTPPGVGMAQKPPRYLQAGDSLRLVIDGLGEQNARVASFA